MSGTTDRHTGQRPRRATALPGASRHVTIVHSDIVGSTDLVAAAGPRYPDLLARHRRLIATSVARRGGSFLSHAGDGTLAIFEKPADALDAAVDAQRALGEETWPAGLTPRVRMGVHAGEVYDLADGEPVGLAVHHGARIMDLAAPGQVLVSEAVLASLPAGGGPRLVGAGRHEVRDHRDPVLLHQVAADGVTVVVPRETHAPILSSVA
jgi:class 3 adenylate cyclase